MTGPGVHRLRRFYVFPHVHWLAPPPPLQTPSRTVAGTTNPSRHLTYIGCHHHHPSIPARVLVGTGQCWSCTRVTTACVASRHPHVHWLALDSVGLVLGSSQFITHCGERRALPRWRYALPAIGNRHLHSLPARTLVGTGQCWSCARVYHGLRSVPTPARTLVGTGQCWSCTRVLAVHNALRGASGAATLAVFISRP